MKLKKGYNQGKVNENAQIFFLIEKDIWGKIKLLISSLPFFLQKKILPKRNVSY